MTGGGGCSCSDRHDTATGNDKAFSSTRLCGWFSVGARIYDDKGVKSLRHDCQPIHSTGIIDCMNSNAGVFTPSFFARAAMPRNADRPSIVPASCPPRAIATPAE